MTQVPLAGEQSALRGYRWQYDHASRLVYDAIVMSDFDKLVLASTVAGQVDDLLLFLNGRRLALQFKGGVSKATISFNELLKSGKTAKGNPTDSLWRSLASAWQSLEPTDGRPLTVHLAMAAVASTSDHVTNSGSQSPDHFRAFLARALEPLMSGERDLSDFPEWNDALERMKKESQLSDHEFPRFLRSVRLNLGLDEALDGSDGTRRDDLLLLSTTLMREVSAGSGTIELDRDQVLNLTSWRDRKSFRSVHEFPINRTTYSPLVGAVKLLQEKLEQAQSGYIAVTGAPGAGKSTLLSQTLPSLPDRVVRYYAFVPGGGGNSRNRLSAEWFLHDLSTMLRDAGLPTRQKQLTARTVSELRQTVIEQLDAAAAEHAKTGRRTIVVVDGLDHVQRDYSGNDALTAELPKPADVPKGVIFIVGSRDLSPLASETRQIVEDQQAEVNLENQRLTKNAVIEICRRIDGTRDLPSEVHSLIADRSAGHPLSLVYLLARVEADAGDDAESFVQSVPQYDGDIAMQYRAAWDALDARDELERVLRICCRLRVGFDLEWVRTWTSDSTVHLFRTQLRYLFRVERKRWRFFHDSFRQFARERTSIGDDRKPDLAIDRQVHAETAAICESSVDPLMESQALYHRYQADDLTAVIALGTQVRFRTQFHALRSGEDIASDAKLLMMAAARMSDPQALLRGLLILSEVQDKVAEIDEVDACRALNRAGLVELAIDYVGDEQRLRVPLAHAYNLAADLAREGNSAGERIFAMYQHFGLEQPGTSRGINSDSDVAEGWARCAVHFLPIATALARIRGVLPVSMGDREWDFDRAYRLFSELLRAYIDEDGLEAAEDRIAIDSLLAVEIENLKVMELSEERVSSLSAVLSDLRFQAGAAHLRSLPSFVDRAAFFADLTSALKGQSFPQESLLELAALEADYGSPTRALDLLRRTRFDRALTLSELGASGDSRAISNRLAYWRMRHELEIGLGLHSGTFKSGPLSSVRASNQTPAGDSIVANAPIHRDSEAIALVASIDLLVRQIALTQALVAGGLDVSGAEVWEVLSGVMNLFPPRKQSDFHHSIHGLRGTRSELHMLTMQALRDVDLNLLGEYERALARRIEAQPSEWPAAVQVTLGVELDRVGGTPSWLRNSLSLFETETTDQGVNGALNDLIMLVDAYVDLEAQDEASRVCMLLWRTTFGMGSRNDYQLRQWVEWLGRIAPKVEDLEAEAMWLAQVLAAAEPLTDQLVGAEQLPELVAATSPRIALSIFEFLVAQGIVSHTDAMAGLLNGLLRSREPTKETVQLAAEMIGAIVAAASNAAHPSLAKTVMSYGELDIIAKLKNDLEKFALPSTRTTWKLALTSVPIVHESNYGEDDRYNDLVLVDQTRLSRSEVRATAVDLDSLRQLLRREIPSSTFKWLEVLNAKFADQSSSTLVDLFGGTAHEAQIVVWAAERENAAGNIHYAQQLARAALALAPLAAWTTSREALRRRSIQILVATGEMTLGEAAEDFVKFVDEEGWYSYLLNSELDDIFTAIGADTTSNAYWLIVREYLEGLAENLTLPVASPNVPVQKWWLTPARPESRLAAPIESGDAVAELLVMHLSHPVWAIREGTAQVIVSALKRGSTEVERAIVRLVADDVTDDILESVAACMAAGASGNGDTLASIRSRIAAHENFIIRRLSSPNADFSDLRISRPLSASYSLILPAHQPFESEVILGGGQPFLAPFEGSYQVLASLTGIDIDAILAAAGRYASIALAKLPTEEESRRSLIGAKMTLSNPSSVVLSSRSAFGRVLGDLVDAGELEQIPEGANRWLRTGDAALIGLAPEPMPEVVPLPPSAGHDQTPQKWTDEIETRLDHYIAASRSGDHQLVGAQSVLTVLNWPHLEESFTCSIVKRSTGRSEPRRIKNAFMSDLVAGADPSDYEKLENLIVANNNMAFMERRADWLALNPIVASRLKWTPDRSLIGGWKDSRDVQAAKSVIWTNGTWGRSGPMFDDTVSEGSAVMVSSAAMREMTEVLGPFDLVFTLTRSDQKLEVPVQAVERRVEL